MRGRKGKPEDLEAVIKRTIAEGKGGQSPLKKATLLEEVDKGQK